MGQEKITQSYAILFKMIPMNYFLFNCIEGSRDLGPFNPDRSELLIYVSSRNWILLLLGGGISNGIFDENFNLMSGCQGHGCIDIRIRLICFIVLTSCLVSLYTFYFPPFPCIQMPFSYSRITIQSSSVRFQHSV